MVEGGGGEVSRDVGFSPKRKKNCFKDCGHTTTYMILPGVSAHAQEKERLNGQRERERDRVERLQVSDLLTQLQQ